MTREWKWGMTVACCCMQAMMRPRRSSTKAAWGSLRLDRRLRLALALEPDTRSLVSTG